MRIGQIQLLRGFVETKTDFILVAYVAESVFRFESRKGWWTISSSFVTMYPDTIEIEESTTDTYISGYSEDGYNLIFQINLKNFFEVKRLKEVKE